MESLCASLEARATRHAVYAILVLAGRFAAGWAGLDALEFAFGVLLIATVSMVTVGYDLRAWRRLKGGASET